MYLKLALRNIRRSVRDYAIYFITLLFGVAVFYAFNSIGSQQILFDMESSASASVFESTTQLLGMFSVVVACVLGFLILYANQFLIRRRKREFGTYLVLGMTPGHVSRIVLYETVLVGLISLAVGLICGVLLSQALSFFTAALFGTTMSNYQFVFSPDALVVTLACFAAIYVVVALFNTFTVSRCKLIDLIRAGERNERAGVRNPWACLVVFVAAIAVLAYAYQQLIANGMVMLDQPEFVRATIAMLVGSLMFFWSLAGFAIAVLTRLRGVYLRKLNLFTVRQIASKVNTAFLSLWAVCVLLFFSITVFSSGMGFVEVFVGGVEKANPYSATLSAGVWYGPDGTTGSSAGERERRNGGRCPRSAGPGRGIRLGHGRRSGSRRARAVGRDDRRMGPGEHVVAARHDLRPDHRCRRNRGEPRGHAHRRLGQGARYRRGCDVAVRLQRRPHPAGAAGRES